MRQPLTLDQREQLLGVETWHGWIVAPVAGLVRIGGLHAVIGPIPSRCACRDDVEPRGPQRRIVSAILRSNRFAPNGFRPSVVPDVYHAGAQRFASPLQAGHCSTQRPIPRGRPGSRITAGIQSVGLAHTSGGVGTTSVVTEAGSPSDVDAASRVHDEVTGLRIGEMSRTSAAV